MLSTRIWSTPVVQQKCLVAGVKKHFGWEDGDEVIVSPVGFPTTISPLVQNNLVPVFVDVEYDTLNFDIHKIERR
jgi:CDP-6-deoxy-D-xylo-4-hexulose-3-dehydrase